MSINLKNDQYFIIQLCHFEQFHYSNATLFFKKI